MTPPLPGSALARVAVVIGTTAVGLALTVVATDPSTIILFSSSTGIGAFLAIRRPDNPIGWLLMAMGWGLAIGSVPVTASAEALAAGSLTPAEALSAWGNGWGWGLAISAIAGVTLLFPSGHLPLGRWRWWSQIGLIVLVGLVVALMTEPTVNVILTPSRDSLDIPNPGAIAPDAAWWQLVPDTTFLYMAIFSIFAASVIRLSLRYRRSLGLERLQYRWLVAALAFVFVATSIWVVGTEVFLLEANGPIGLVVIVAYPTVPMAIGIAVLRYRLYEIDRIVSRSIAYLLVTAVLLAIFGGAVLLLSTALASVAGGQSIAVAGSTLIAYAAFQPVLGRVRRAVDRRFDRARYDGERTATVFAARVRDETDVEAVIHDLAATTRSVVAPTSLVLWLRPRDVTR